MNNYYPDTDNPKKLYYVEFNRGDRRGEFTLFKRQFILPPEQVKGEFQRMANEGHPWNIFTANYGPDGCVPDRAWVCWMVDCLNDGCVNSDGIEEKFKKLVSSTV